VNGIADHGFIRPLGQGNAGRCFPARTPERRPVQDGSVAAKVLIAESKQDGFRAAGRALQAFAAPRPELADAIVQLDAEVPAGQLLRRERRPWQRMSEHFIEGDEVGGYRIESFIARGGMAVVYRARDTRLNRPVALKVLAPELAENESFRKRFIRESELAASIDHPHIIPIYRAGRFGNALYLAMRFVHGTDLRGLLARTGPLDLPMAVRLFDQIGSALDVAHAHDLVHRDVKPGNVLVEDGGGPGRFHLYLTDFGLTKRIASLSGLTAPGHFLGTVDYIAPEQIAGRPADARTDVYALGCVLFEALTGNRPFDRETDAAVLFAHLNDRPPSVAAARSDLPRVVDRIVAKALAKEPGGRYASCHDMVTDLRALATRAAPAPGPGGAATRPGATRPGAARPGAAGSGAADGESRPTRYHARRLPPEADDAARSRVTREHPTPLQPLQPHGGPARPPVPRKPTAPQPAPAAGGREQWIGLALRVALGVLAVVAVVLMFADLRS